MSLRVHHTSGNQECIAQAATTTTPFRGLPKPFPLSATWAVYVDSTAPDDYMTCLSYGPDPFTNTDYYQAAVRISSATGSLDATWNVGAGGAFGDYPTAGWPVIGRSRWFYQAYRIHKVGTVMRAEFYYDLPDVTKMIDNSADGNDETNYLTTITATHSFRFGDNNWPTTAPNEEMEGEFQGIKVWQAWLDVPSLKEEAFNIWPVKPQWAGMLWDMMPCISKFDKHRNNIKRINNRPWTFPNVEPTTGNRRAPLQSLSLPNWLYPNDGLTILVAAAGDTGEWMNRSVAEKSRTFIWETY